MLAANGVEEIQALGETFDPTYHEAVSAVVDENLGEKVIKEEYRKGYKMCIRDRQYSMPEENMYIPLHVGKEGKQDLGYVGDNTGEHISHKNNYYCELTGMYWAWKNLDAEYIGLCHYRRYFTKAKNVAKKEEQKFKQVLHEAEVQKMLDYTDIILPKKRKYYIENLYDHYKHTLHEEPLAETRKIIEEKYPQYIDCLLYTSW